MPALYMDLKDMQQDFIKNFLIKASKPTAADKAARRAAKQEIKAFIKILALRFGFDLLNKHFYQMKPEEKNWVIEQAKQALQVLEAEPSLSAQAKLYFYVKLNELIGLYGGTQVNRSEFYTKRAELEGYKTAKTQFNWSSALSGAALAAHGGLLAYHAAGTVSTVGLVGFGSSIIAAIGTGAAWLANQSRAVLAKISLAESAALPILKTVGIVLYAVFMSPLILRTLYKNLRNIFALNKYADKRANSAGRLVLSVLFAATGAALGIVAGIFAWGGGPLVAVGLAALGWVIGHSLYKFLKRNRDASVYFGTTNPQKWFLTREQMEAALTKAQQASTAASHPFDRAVVMHNLMSLVVRLTQKAQDEKEKRRQERWWIFGLTYRLWGLDFSTKHRKAAEEAMRDIKRGNWDRAQAYLGASYLAWDLHLTDFSTTETRTAQAAAYAAAMSAAPPTLTAVPGYVLPVAGAAYPVPLASGATAYPHPGMFGGGVMAVAAAYPASAPPPVPAPAPAHGAGRVATPPPYDKRGVAGCGGDTSGGDVDDPVAFAPGTAPQIASSGASVFGGRTAAAPAPASAGMGGLPFATGMGGF